MATYTGHVARHECSTRPFTQFPRLEERRKQTAGTMSGGEQQMLAMARALATDPALLLIDELSMGLAPIIVESLYEHVARACAESGLSILIVEQFAQSVLGVADHRLDHAARPHRPYRSPRRGRRRGDRALPGWRTPLRRHRAHRPRASTDTVKTGETREQQTTNEAPVAETCPQGRKEQP